jgi:hypothetical protein
MDEFKIENHEVAGLTCSRESENRAGGSLADLSDCSLAWPRTDSFFLWELLTLKKLQISKGDWLGVYQSMPLTPFSQWAGYQELLCASRSPAVLYRKLKVAALTFPVIVRRTSSRNDLPKQIESAKPDRFRQLSRSAYEAVAEARNMLKPSSLRLPMNPIKGFAWFVWELSDDRLVAETEKVPLYRALENLCVLLLTIEERTTKWTLSRPQNYLDLATEFRMALEKATASGYFLVHKKEAQDRIEKFLSSSVRSAGRQFGEMSRAADFLRTLANEARRKGGKPGDRATVEEIRKALVVFNRLARGETLKAIAQIAIDDEVDDVRSLRQYKSFERLTKRFGKRVAEAVHKEFGPNIPTLNYNYLFHALRDWPGIDRREDRFALMQAAKQALPKVRLV